MFRSFFRRIFVALVRLVRRRRHSNIEIIRLVFSTFFFVWRTNLLAIMCRLNFVMMGEPKQGIGNNFYGQIENKWKIVVKCAGVCLCGFMSFGCRNSVDHMWRDWLFPIDLFPNNRISLVNARQPCGRHSLCTLLSAVCAANQRQTNAMKLKYRLWNIFIIFFI